MLVHTILGGESQRAICWGTCVLLRLLGTCFAEGLGVLVRVLRLPSRSQKQGLVILVFKIQDSGSGGSGILGLCHRI